MKLFYFEGSYGMFDYYVMAETEEEACQAVDEYIKKSFDKDDDWPQGHDPKIAEPLEVLSRFNS